MAAATSSAILKPRISRVEEGQQYYVETRCELPLSYIELLGHGGSASVEKVQDLKTGTVYARKIYKINGSRAHGHRIFENEVKVIRRLSHHHHIIRVFATYAAKREVGLILTPVADRGSLDDLLQAAHDDPLSVEDTNLLWSSFACLASGLYFMHTQSVRHKDIKPHNILIHEGSFIYTDFGCSLDYSASTRSVTTGIPDSVTQRYAAPEVRDQSPRSSRTDIFSLACVFFEILCALGSCAQSGVITPYRDHIREMRHSLQMGGVIDAWQQLVVKLTGLMLAPNCEARPSAQNVTAELWRFHLDRFCTQCHFNLPVMNPAAFPPALPTGFDISVDTVGTVDVMFQAVNYDTDVEMKGMIMCDLCAEEFSCVSNYKKHKIKHQKPFICDYVGCKRGSAGFTTVNDLERHKKSVHKDGSTPSYRCAAEDCRNKEKLWPRLDNFRQHVERMHKEMDPRYLIQRSRIPPNRMALAAMEIPLLAGLSEQQSQDVEMMD